MFNHFISVFFRAALVGLLLCSYTSCSGVEQGTGQAIDNLGSVIDSESKKVWIPADEEDRNRPAEGRY